MKFQNWVIFVVTAVTMGASLLYFNPMERERRSPAAIHPEICERIYETVCDALDSTSDPTGDVRSDQEGERRAQEIYREIRRGSPGMGEPEIREELSRRIYTEARRQAIRTAFEWAKKSMIRFIEEQPDSIFSRREKLQLKRRLKRVQLELPPPASLYSDEPDLFMKSDVYYERSLNGAMKLRVGGAYLLNVSSKFNHVFTLAHELAHAIDPCEVRSANLDFPAYSRLTGCFLNHGKIQTRPTRYECGADDQLSETFADWMAAQVTTQALLTFGKNYRGQAFLNALGNSVRDLCEVDADTEFHPPPRVRIDRIFGQNPGIRKLLGCSPEHGTPAVDYCDFR